MPWRLEKVLGTARTRTRVSIIVVHQRRKGERYLVVIVVKRCTPSTQLLACAAPLNRHQQSDAAEGYRDVVNIIGASLKRSPRQSSHIAFLKSCKNKSANATRTKYFALRQMTHRNRTIRPARGLTLGRASGLDFAELQLGRDRQHHRRLSPVPRLEGFGKHPRSRHRIK